MVEKTRNGLNSGSRTADQISEIFEFFAKGYLEVNGHKVEIYSAVIDALSRLDAEKQWTWKYLSNIEHGHIKPGKRLVSAIDVLYRMIRQEPIYKPAPICPDCQEVPLSKRHRCPARANGSPHRQPPIRVATLTEAERVAVLAQTPAERKRRLLDEMQDWY